VGGAASPDGLDCKRRPRLAISCKNHAEDAQIARISHAIQRKNASLWEIPDNLRARSGTFLAAFPQNGVVRAVPLSAMRNLLSQHPRNSATL
jgi:hypothetical protein